MIGKYFSLFQVFTDKSKKKQPSAKGSKRKHSAMGGESAKKSKKVMNIKVTLTNTSF